MHHGDFRVRQLDATVQGGDFRRAPLGDLAQVDVGNDFTRHFQLAWGHAVQVDDGDHAAHDGRELHQARFFQLFRLQRHVRSAEFNSLGLDLLDASAGTDGLVVQAIARVGFVRLGPFGVDRVREGCTSTCHICRHDGSGRKCHRCRSTHDDKFEHLLHLHIKSSGLLGLKVPVECCAV
ncbi:hypothetical protein D3C72_1300710 [compost metagenome]